ncbi:MAG: family 20 glycosylhydrolase [Steroidobacter sp.]
MKSRHIVIGALAALALSGCGSQSTPPPSDTAASIALVPVPRDLERGVGEFVITPATRLEVGDSVEAKRVADYFVELVSRTQGVDLDPAGNGNVVRFTLTPGDSNGSAEGYSLVVSPEKVVVNASDPRGLFYGAVTLWQLITKRGDELVLPAVKIDDAPRFAWRGLMLDSARHYQSPESIRKFIDVMALHKFNVFHWHLTDDQGWRLAIKKYPKLTEVGAWRVPAGQAPAANIDPATGKPQLYGGFYTQDQVREIVAYAASRHITVVPEIDLPGHASAAIAAYPQLAVVPEAVTQVPADWGIYQNLFNVEETTFKFFEDVLTEVIELFPGQYIHVGGDEAVKDQWKASAKVQARMRELGVKDEHELQSYYITRMEKFLSGKGRRLIGWDEILEGGLAPNATVMSWRGIDGAVAAASSGHDAVLSPWPILYFDNRPVDVPIPGRGRIVSVEQVYGFDPMPAALSETQRKHILGLQANLWTEYMRTPDRLEYMAFPRAAAVAEIAWSPAAKKNWADFSARLPAQQERYKALNTRYAEALPPRTLQANRRTSHELNLCSDKIALSLEDDAPVYGERATFLVDIMEPCWLFKEADLSAVTAISAEVGQVPFNFQIGDAVKQIKLRAPATPVGELEVRVDGCSGERIAVLPLALAVTNHAVTKLPPATIPPRAGKHDLCFTFTQKTLDPIWVLGSVELLGASGAQGSVQ